MDWGRVTKSCSNCSAARVLVMPRDAAKKDTPLFIFEVMKMEITITAVADGRVKAVHLATGSLVEQGDLVVELERY